MRVMTHILDLAHLALRPSQPSVVSCVCAFQGADPDTNGGDA